MADSQRPDLEAEAADSNQSQTSPEEGISGTVQEAGSPVEGQQGHPAGTDTAANAVSNETSFDTDEDIPTPS